MIFFYNFLIEIADFFLPLFKNVNNKLKQGVEGRKKTSSILRKNIKKKDSVLWFHCASLGEYEQGLPVFEKIKAQNPNSKIVLSFFSPSGYENLKDNPITPIVVYLPLDTRKNVDQFITELNPSLVIFVKSEIWPNYLLALNKHSTKVILISAVFKSNKYWFKLYDVFSRKVLSGFDHIFTQDIQSKKALQKIGYENITVSNDTRFDRVTDQLEKDNSLPFIDKFLNSQQCIVAGSTWPEDEKILFSFIKNSPKNIKFIIAPHSINNLGIQKLLNVFGSKAVLYSNHKIEDIAQKQVFIIDIIGILTKIYSYADIAYIGGGMGKNGLHNTLEAAVFGIPIIIGKNYSNFPEAVEMYKNGGLMSVRTAESFNDILDKLLKNKKLLAKCGEKNKNFIIKNKGATSIILNKLSYLY